ncbi:MAG: hypothetical protein MUC36_15490 [Planctomycetes bacterium]|nr:hypothetical protein [Planctomycetota bacterium]
MRKEPVLALLTLGLAGWIGSGYLETPTATSRWSPKKLEFVPGAVAEAPLVAAAAAAAVRADFCTEPSETRPLPPRELDFPPRTPLSVAALPLDPGPDYGHSWMLRLDGAAVEGVTLTPAGEAAAPAVDPGAAPADPTTSTRKQREEVAARTYDRIYVQNLQSPFFGTIENEGLDLFQLESDRQFEGVLLRLRSYDVDRQKVGPVVVYGGDTAKIDRIVLAGTLRNEITRRERKVPRTEGHLPELREFIDWLLQTARTEAWVYDKALEQAEAYRQLAGGDIDGLRMMQRVLRARGDLAGEAKMLEGLSTEGREGAFRFEGLGTLKARLGLWEAAEADLRQAVQLAPTDARSHGALAEFLRQRGRTREALVVARRAEQTLGNVQDAAENARVRRLIAGCLLAHGEVEAARTVAAGAQREHASAYLDGCIAYAAGDTAAALTAFRLAGTSADSGAALLGQAACLLRDGQWQEANDLFVRVADQEPLLRHRAATGLALLCSRLGQHETAQVWLDRALEADPQDPYAHYLRGRTLRLLGQATAEAELAMALRLRDDFVHAIAEMAAVQTMRARDSRGEDQAAAILAARRYGDRAVALAPMPAAELYELQGLHAFAAGDASAAKDAFGRARDLAADDAGRAYGKGALAVVDYSRGLVDDAAAALARLVQDLGKEAPLSQWATATLAAIDDHAEKEALGDSFDRADLGTIWAPDTEAGVRMELLDGRFVIKGQTSKGAVGAERNDAVKRARNFLSAAVVLQIGSTHSRNEGFAGLGIELRGGGGAVDCQVRVGIFEGKPFLTIQDGREDGSDNVQRVPLQIDGLAIDGRHELELRTVPRGDPQGKQLSLHVSWNGVVVHRHDLKSLNGNSQNPLRIALFATGSKRSTIDVAFDDFELERRKEQTR